jgi:O-antigen/teichoic acid export membrane protein
MSGDSASLTLVAVLAGFALVSREYFRMVLLAYRLAHDVLRSDVVHVVLLLTGALIASRTPHPALAALGALGVSALISGHLLRRALHRHQEWEPRPVPGLLRQIAPLATWSTAGSGIHWAFSQGYIYLVAATLGTTAVAALAATRLLLMPVNLLSAGIGSLMLPTATSWLHHHGAALVLRRLRLLAAGMTTIALGYFCVLWLGRDWLFTHVLRTRIEQRDTLLLLWGAIFLLIVVREQIIYLMAAQGRFRTLTLLTLGSAVLSLTATWLGIRHFGIVGALSGVLLGEMVNLTGIILSSRPGASTPQRSNGITAASSGVVRNSH